MLHQLLWLSDWIFAALVRDVPGEGEGKGVGMKQDRLPRVFSVFPVVCSCIFCAEKSSWGNILVLDSARAAWGCCRQGDSSCVTWEPNGEGFFCAALGLDECR